jgi:putative ABC transport system substrate-binding protein
MTITRRSLLQLALFSLGAVASVRPRDAAAQSGSLPRIGFLAPGPSAAMQDFAAAFRRGLAGQGYIDGETIAVEWRWMDEPGNTDAEADAAALARLPLRLVVAPTLREVQAVQRANPQMPIVTVAVGDPVALKLVPKLGHPGGMITGLTDYRADFARRRLSLLKDALPLLNRVAFLRDPAASSVAQTEAAATALHITLVPIDLTKTADLEPALSRLGADRVEALIVAPDPLSFAHRGRIAAAATALHLPIMFGYSDFMDVDGLMSFGADLEQLYVQAARYVHDILNGAKPGDLPILGPSRVELIVNLRNAHDLGLELPPALLAKADRLIE